VRRFWNGTPGEHGTLTSARMAGGVFYEVGDDEPIFRLSRHLFAPPIQRS
jgi:hypothetical protein